MKTLGRILLRVLVIILVLLALAWMGVAALRWQVLDEHAYAALTRMSEDTPVPPGENGYAALMLADYETGDLDAAGAEAALAADVARFADWYSGSVGALQAHVEDGGPEPGGFEPFADRGWPRRPVLAPNDARFCGLGGQGCLAQVAADPDAARAGLQEEAKRLDAMRRVLAAAHMSNPYLPTWSTPVPSWSLLRLPVTDAALAAADGRIDEAYAQTCDLLAAARRFDRSARGIIDKRVAQSAAEGAAALLLDLRRAHPRPALPESCAEAIAEVDAAEAGICLAMKGEFRMGQNLTNAWGRHGSWRPDRVLARQLLTDSAVRNAWNARAMAPFCADDADTRALAGEVARMVPTPAVGSTECLAAYIDCSLLAIAMPAIDVMAAVGVDHAAKLRLLLAAQAVADGRLAPAAAAAAAGVPGHPVAFDPATGTASLVPKWRSGNDTPFVVELAGLVPPGE
ncbi:hypothetical protein [Arenimonas composti]|uniref:Uncharacterized protein n=1 Tax=Arenimonas composti TR7-09 = DSM 18010 TaxID=1121013 RepID=A0A091BDB4_9GAMM|nr:hypothetical protein [Arenimonas composti]KFN50673.1 hypothetical protein P873_05795 [Arenimonas composti TR7-09 = DSM 18010]